MAFIIFRMVLVDGVEKHIPIGSPYSTREQAEAKRKEFERTFYVGKHKFAVVEVDDAGTISSAQTIQKSFERKAIQ